MKQLITRVDETLADALKQRAQISGESVNAYITRVLGAEVGDRASWKRDAIAAGVLSSRPSRPAPKRPPRVTTPAGYAAALISADRDDR